MRKKIGILSLLIISFSLFLYACAKPYKNMTLTLSETDVILYINSAQTDGDNLNEQNPADEDDTLSVDISSKKILATVGGAGKKVNKGVIVSQSGNAVSVTAGLEASGVTEFTLTALNKGKSTITVTTREGNLKKNINVTVYIAINGVDFSTRAVAVSKNSPLNLNNFLSFSPNGTNQTEMEFYLDDTNNPKQPIFNSDGYLVGSTYASISNGVLYVLNEKDAPRRTLTTHYIPVVGYSKHNSELKTTRLDVPIVDIIEDDEISLYSNSELEGVKLLDKQNGVYQVVLGSNIDDKYDVFTRELLFMVGGDYSIDIDYKVTTQYKNDGVVVVTNRTDYNKRENIDLSKPIDEYPYTKFLLAQNKFYEDKSEQIIVFDIDYIRFEKLFTKQIVVKVIVKEFPTQINIYSKDGNLIGDGQEVEVYNNYGSNLLGTQIKVVGMPNVSGMTYTVSTENATKLSITNNQREIGLNSQNLANESVLTLKHSYNTSDVPANVGKITIIFTYSVVPAGSEVEYATYIISKDILVRYKIGLESISVNKNMYINASNRTSIMGGVVADEIVLAYVNNITTNLYQQLSEIKITRFNDRAVTSIPNFNINPIDNDYYKLVFDESTNKIYIIPNSNAMSGDFVVRLITENGIVEDSSFKIIVPLAYENSTTPNIYIDINSENLFAESHADYMATIDEYNDVKTEVDDGSVVDKLSYYKTISATLSTNSRYVLNINNFITNWIDNNPQTLPKAVNFSDHVVVSAPSAFFTVKNEIVGGKNVKVLYTNSSTISNRIISFTFNGYDKTGNAYSVKYEMRVSVEAPLQKVDITPKTHLIYDIDTVGTLNESASKVAFQVETIPALNMTNDTNGVVYSYNANEIVFAYNYKENLVEYFTISDIASLSSSGELSAKLADKFYDKLDKIYLAKYRNDENSQVDRKSLQYVNEKNIVINSIYAKDVVAKVEVSVTRYKSTMYAQADVFLERAVKVTDIIISNIDNTGLYYDVRNFNVENGKKKNISVYALPQNATNKNLVATISNNTVARIIDGVNQQGVVTGGVILIEGLLAGETTLKISAQDSFVKNNDVDLGTVYTSIRIKVADGSKAYPFEISSTNQFLAIRNDYKNGNNSFYYVLTKDINLSGISSFEALPYFNGGLSGLFTYESNGIKHKIQNTIYGLSIKSKYTVQYSSDQSGYSNINYGIFSVLSKNAEIINLFIKDAVVDLEIDVQESLQGEINFDKFLNVGIIAGENFGQIINPSVSGSINVVGNIKNYNIGGVVGAVRSEYMSDTLRGVVVANDTLAIEGSVADFNANVEITLTSNKNTNPQNNQNIGGVAGSVVSENTDTLLMQNHLELYNLYNLNVVASISSIYKDVVYTNGVENTIYLLNGGNLGGVVGHAKNIVANKIVVSPKISGYHNVGGVVGYADNTIIASAVVEFIDGGYNGYDKSASLIATNYVGGIVGVGKNIFVQYSYARSYFYRAIDNENYLGNIVVVSQDNSPQEIYVGGLVGFVYNDESVTSLYCNYETNVYAESKNAIINSIVEVERTHKNNIQSSYFNADINTSLLGDDDVVYVGGIIGGYEKDADENTSEEKNINALNLTDVYVVGNIIVKSIEDKIQTSTVVMNENPINNNEKIVDLSTYNVGTVVTTTAVGNKLITETTYRNPETIIVESEEVEDEEEDEKVNFYIDEVVTTTTENMFGIFIGQEKFEINESTDSINNSQNIKVFASLKNSSNNTNSVVNTSYASINAGKKSQRNVVVGSNDNVENIEIIYFDQTIVKTENVKTFAVNSFEISVNENIIVSDQKTIVDLTDTRLFVDNNFSIIENSDSADVLYAVNIFDNDDRLLGFENVVLKSSVVPSVSLFRTGYDNKYTNAMYIEFTMSNKWFGYEGLNDNMPLLINSGQNGLLYKVLPTSLTASVLDFNVISESINYSGFTNRSYIKVDNNKAVVMFNEKMSGSNITGDNEYIIVNTALTNTYEIVFYDEDDKVVVFEDSDRHKFTGNRVPVLSDFVYEQVKRIEYFVKTVNSNYGIIEIELNTNLQSSAFLQPEIDTGLVVKSSNTKAVSIVDGNIIKTQGLGHTVVTISARLNTNIFTSVELLVVKGLSDFNLYEDKSMFDSVLVKDNQSVSIFVEQTKNMYLSAINEFTKSPQLSTYQTNDNVGVIVKVGSAGGGIVSLSGATLEEGRVYVYTSLKEFNVFGINKGNVQITLTPVVLHDNDDFAIKHYDSQNSDSFIKGIKIDALKKTYNFEVLTSATSINTNNKTSATISPLQTTSVDVSVITSVFSMTNNSENPYSLDEMLQLKIYDLSNNLLGNITSVDMAKSVEGAYEFNNSLVAYGLEKVDIAPHTITDDVLLEIKATYTIKLYFNTSQYRENAQNTTYNLNSQNFVIVFSPYSNANLKASFNLNIVPNDLQLITAHYYAGNEQTTIDGQTQFNPQETSSTYIAPGRIGLLKLYLFPEFNNADIVEVTVNDEMKQFVNISQRIESYISDSNSSVNGYIEINKPSIILPTNNGIRLYNESINSEIDGTRKNTFNGSYFVSVLLSSTVKTNETVTLTISGYSTKNNEKIKVQDKSVVLSVQPLPSMEIDINGEINTNIAIGTQEEINIVATNFDGVPEFVVTSAKNNVESASVEEINGKFYLLISDNAILGDTITLTAIAKRIINGIEEKTTPSVVVIKVVEFLVKDVYVNGVGGQNAVKDLEILNGTVHELSVGIDAKYSTTAMSSTISTNKLIFERVVSGKVSSSSNTSEQYFNYWNIRRLYNNTYEYYNLLPGASYDHNSVFEFGQVSLVSGLSKSTYFVIKAKQINNGSYTLSFMLEYYYSAEGKVMPYTNESNVDVYKKSFDFRLIIKDNSTYDNPLPIYDIDDFMSMEEGAHYILLNDLVIDNHTPQIANFASFDGNGFVIKINSFNFTSLVNASTTSIVAGLFTSVNTGAVVKNVTIDVSELLITKAMANEINKTQDVSISNKAKINLAGITNVTFGMLAGINHGTITNAKVVNVPDTIQENNIENRSLFIYTTQGFISGQGSTSGSATSTLIGGVVGVNNGSISNSYIGQNYATLNNSEDEVLYLNKSYIYKPDKNNTNDINQINKKETYGFMIVGGKSVGAFVHTNNGTISNSFNKETGIANIAETTQNSHTAGFVVNNSGKIYNAFVEGNLRDGDIYRANDSVYLEGNDKISGFVYNNSGLITNTYSNIFIKTTSGNSAGFVFINDSSGQIINAYSASNNSAANSSVHGLFTGIDINNNFQNSGKYDSVFYLLLDNETGNSNEPAIAIKGISSSDNDDVDPFSESISFNGFGFVDGNDDNGIWKLPNKNAKRGPVLNGLFSSNSYSHRYLKEVKLDINVVGGQIYDYEYVMNIYGSQQNPILINTPEEFIKIIINISTKNFVDNLNVFGHGDRRYVRLVKNLNFNEIVLDKIILNGLKIYDITFAGVLDGNGFDITNLSLIDERKNEHTENFGLFYQVGLSNQTREKLSESLQDITATIKNISISVGNFESANTTKVGALAGSIYNSNLINVEVVGNSNIRISGRNLVGGLAGLIINSDNNIISNINIENISLLASHNSAVNIKDENTVNQFGFVENYNTYKNFNNNSDLESYSYSGSVAGVIIANNRSENNSGDNIKRSIVNDNNDITLHRSSNISGKVSNITVTGSTIRAMISGGLFGYVGENTHLTKSNYFITNNGADSISGYIYAGGIVGENYGMLEQVFVEYIENTQNTFDNDRKNKITAVRGSTSLFGNIVSVAIGGITGYSDNSIILDSYSHANVVSGTAKVAGGIIGIATRKTYLSHVFTTGDVFAKYVIGGVVGIYNNTGEKMPGITGANASSTDKILFDYVIGLNYWGEGVNNAVRNNIKDYYRKISDAGLESYYNYNVIMAEIGNLTPEITSAINLQGYVNSHDVEMSELEKAEYDKLIKILTPNTYIGSLLGVVSDRNSYSSFYSSSNVVFEKVVESRKVNIIKLPGIAETEEISTVITSTLQNADVDYLNKDITNLWPIVKYPTLKGDIIKYSKGVGLQKHQLGIIGLDDVGINHFMMWFTDAISKDSINIDSTSKVWKSNDNDGVFPEYITGVYSNYKKIKNDFDLKELMKTSNTSGQFYIISPNENSSDGSYKIDSSYDINSSMFNYAFKGTLIGKSGKVLNDLEVDKPKIIFNVYNTSASGSISRTSIFDRISSATITNIDFDIVYNITSTGSDVFNEFEIDNNVSGSYTSVGVLARHVTSSVISNTKINIKSVYSGDITDSEKTSTINLVVAVNKNINTFGLVIGYGLQSSFSGILINVESDINVVTPTIRASQKIDFNVGGVFGNIALSTLSDINVVGNNNYFNINATKSEVSNVVIGGVVSKITNGANLFNINNNILSGGNKTNLQIKLSSVNTKSNVIMGGIVGDIVLENSTKSTILNNVYYLGNLQVGSSSEPVNPQVLVVGGIVGNSKNLIIRGGFVNAYYDNNHNNLTVNKYSENDQENAYKTTIFSGANIYFGGIAGKMIDGFISSYNNYHTTINASNIVVNNTGVVGKQNYVGGIVGYSTSTLGATESAGGNGVSKAVNIGEIEFVQDKTANAVNTIGGIVGYADGIYINEVANYGLVNVFSGSQHTIGGIVGKIDNISTSVLRNFVVYGDILVNKKDNTTFSINYAIGGVVGMTKNSNLLVVKYGFNYGKISVNNYKNETDYKYILPIGYGINNKIDNQVFYINEFVPLSNQFGAISYSQLNALVYNSNNFEVYLPGQDTVNYNINFGNGSGNNSWLWQEQVSHIDAPRLANIVSLEKVDSQFAEGETLLNKGDKLNPHSLSSLDTLLNGVAVSDSIYKVNDHYFLMSDGISSATTSSSIEFSGVLVGVRNATTGKYPEIERLRELHIFNNNSGIISNIGFKVSKGLNNNSAYLTYENIGYINNVSVYGYVMDKVANKNIAGMVFNNKGIISYSATSIIFEYPETVSYGAISYNNNTGAIIYGSYSTSSILNGVDVKFGGISYVTNGRISNSYFAGSVNYGFISKSDSEYRVLAYEIESTSSFYEVRHDYSSTNIVTKSGYDTIYMSEKIKLTENSSGSAERAEFNMYDTNSDLSINYGYFIVKNGVLIPTIARIETVVNTNIGVITNTVISYYNWTNKEIYQSTSDFVPIFSAGMFVRIGNVTSSLIKGFVLITHLDFAYFNANNKDQTAIYNKDVNLNKDLYGYNNTIRNMKIFNNAIFDKISNVNVSNINFENIQLSNTKLNEDIGILAGSIENSNVLNIWFDNIKITGFDGGDLGVLAGKIVRSSNDLKIISNITVSFNSAANKITDLVKNNIEIKAKNIGGVIGYAENYQIHGLYVHKAIINRIGYNDSSKLEYGSGGAIGQIMRSNVFRLYVSKTDVYSTYFAGGIIGIADSYSETLRNYITNLEVINSNIKAEYFVGGVFGKIRYTDYDTVTVQNNPATNYIVNNTTVTGKQYVGGIAGSAGQLSLNKHIVNSNGYVINSNSRVNVSVNGYANTGGLFGSLSDNSIVKNLYFEKGDITYNNTEVDIDGDDGSRRVKLGNYSNNRYVYDGGNLSSGDSQTLYMGWDDKNYTWQNFLNSNDNPKPFDLTAIRAGGAWVLPSSPDYIGDTDSIKSNKFSLSLGFFAGVKDNSSTVQYAEINEVDNVTINKERVLIKGLYDNYVEYSVKVDKYRNKKATFSINAEELTTKYDSIKNYDGSFLYGFYNVNKKEYYVSNSSNLSYEAGNYIHINDVLKLVNYSTGSIVWAKEVDIIRYNNDPRIHSSERLDISNHTTTFFSRVREAKQSYYTSMYGKVKTVNFLGAIGENYSIVGYFGENNLQLYYSDNNFGSNGTIYDNVTKHLDNVLLGSTEIKRGTYSSAYSSNGNVDVTNSNSFTFEYKRGVGVI